MAESNQGPLGMTLALKSAFTQLRPEELAELREFAQSREFPAGTVLCREGETDRTLYVLRSGMVRVTQQLPDGEERLVALRGKGEFFGEASLLDDSPRQATATAVDDITAIEITEQVFARVLEQSPSLALALMHRAQQDLRSIMARQMEELTAKNAALAKAYDELKAAQERIVESERLKRDLEIAAQLQRSILPAEFPEAPGFSFAAVAEPAREMGGDFYDVFRLDKRRIGLLVADVSDKSVPAAMFMAISHTLFLTESRRHRSPLAVAAAVNDELQRVTSADMFVTAFYGVIDVPKRRLTYVRAGHDRPLLMRAGGELETLDGAGRFLGMLPNFKGEERRVKLRAGDRLVLYSDGITDAINPAGDRYSMGRLRRLVGELRSAAADAYTRRIVADVRRFQGAQDQFDDITLLVAALD